MKTIPELFLTAIRQTAKVHELSEDPYLALGDIKIEMNYFPELGEKHYWATLFVLDEDYLEAQKKSPTEGAHKRGTRISSDVSPEIAEELTQRLGLEESDSAELRYEYGALSLIDFDKGLEPAIICATGDWLKAVDAVYPEYRRK